MLEKLLPKLGQGYDINYIKRFLARHYVKAGRFEAALKIYLHCGLSSLPSPFKAEMLKEAATCHEALQHRDKAIACLTEILTFARESDSPVDGPSHENVVICEPRFFEEIFAALSRNYEACGDLERARAAFRKEKEYYAKTLTAQENAQKGPCGHPLARSRPTTPAVP